MQYFSLRIVQRIVISFDLMCVVLQCMICSSVLDAMVIDVIMETA